MLDVKFYNTSSKCTKPYNIFINIADNGILGSTVNWAVLNWIDWTIIVVLSASTLLSLWRGFAREALSLVGWVAAFILSSIYADKLAVLSVDLIDNESARYVVAFALLFVGVLLLFNLMGLLLKQLIHLTGLSLLDRLLGTVFGFTRGVIVLLVVVFVVREILPPDNQHALRQSRLMPHLDMLMQWTQSMFGKMDIGSALDSEFLDSVAVPEISI